MENKYSFELEAQVAQQDPVKYLKGIEDGRAIAINSTAPVNSLTPREMDIYLNGQRFVNSTLTNPNACAYSFGLMTGFEESKIEEVA